MKKPDILVIIPARGGSKGIPRKNLRMLNGFPLIYYAIKMALASIYKPCVYVSSEDKEILTLSKKFGANIHKRPVNLAKDLTTLDPVIFEAYKAIKTEQKKEFKLIITVQATSPLLKTQSFDAAIKKMLDKSGIDTVISAKEDTHLSWRFSDNKYIPNYKKRLNRQELIPNFKETGGFLITRDTVISEDTRIGKNVELQLLSSGEDIDIDSYEDWNLCAYYLRQKIVLFVLAGYKEIGLGHVYNALSLADEITSHRIIFLVDEKSQLALEKIKSINFPVFKQQSKSILDDINRLSPDIVINDRLDTSPEYIQALKLHKYCVINFEDLGDGARFADLVINAMYPETNNSLLNHYFGEKYFILRNEFQFTKSKKLICNKVLNVLLTFGGVDPNNFTKKVVQSIYDYCLSDGIEIHVAAGIGYDDYFSLKQYDKIIIHKNASNLSELIFNADIVFTSAGRTTFEVASIGTPAIVLCQNTRETTHFFAHEKFGFINLGLGTNVSDSKILSTFSRLVDQYEIRKHNSSVMLKNDLKAGKSRVIQLIENIIKDKIS